MNEKTLQLNGPVNFFRLKNNEKEIYIFCDHLEDIANQEECDDLKSFNFDKYLKLFFEKNKKNVDFMLETSKNIFVNKYNDKNNTYMIKIKKAFVDLKLNNPYYKYLKIHYIDIKIETIIYETFRIIKFIDFFNFDIAIENLKNIIILYQEQLKIIEKFKNNENSEINKKNILDVFFHKIIVKYNNKENKKIINEYFDIMCYKKIKYVTHLIEKLILILKNNKLNNKITFEHANKKKELFKHYIIFKYNNGELTNKIKQLTEEITTLILDIGIYIMDCYFFRRLLDKKYIKNTIIYVSMYHSANYLHFLVKYCNYKIIEYEFIDNKTSKELENIIKKTNSWIDIFNYIDRYKQCIKIKQLFT